MDNANRLYTKNITLYINYLQISVKSKTSRSTKEVIENLDAKLLDLQKKSIPLAGSSAPKSSSTYITPLTGTLSSSKIDVDSIVSNFETKMQSTTSKEPNNKENN
jgi:hypothetical protein